MRKNGKRVIDFFVFFSLSKKQRTTNELLATNDQSCMKPWGAPGINSFMGAASGGHKRFETIKKFAIRKFE